MKVKLNKYTWIYISIFIITISESIFVNNRGLDNIFEYIGYGILLIYIIISFFKKDNYVDKKGNFMFFIVILILSSIGLWFQDITKFRLFILEFTILAISMISVLSVNCMCSLDIIRGGAYAILIGIITSSLLGIIGGDGIIDNIKAGEGILGISLGLNGGIVFKNYYSADLLVIYISLYIYGKYIKQKSIDKLTKILCLILCVLSNSRGGLLLFAIFVISTNYSIIYSISKKYRKFIVLLAIIIIGLVTVNIFNNIILGFSTYAYRFRGLLNYLNYYNGDSFHMIFGNAESFYDKSNSYVMAVRSTTGYDGSLEMAWLNILIKSGLLGVLAYAFIFIRMFKLALKANDKVISVGIMAITITLLASSLVEAYIQSIHCIYGMMSYMAVNGLYGCDLKFNSKEQKR